MSNFKRGRSSCDSMERTIQGAGVKNLFLLFLLAISVNASGESLITLECLVDGKQSSTQSETIITNQKIAVTIEIENENLLIKVEGNNKIKINAIKDKPQTLNDKEIGIFTLKIFNDTRYLYTISLNRITGFIDVNILFLNTKTLETENSEYSGFCNKTNNTSKF